MRHNHSYPCPNCGYCPCCGRGGSPPTFGGIGDITITDSPSGNGSVYDPDGDEEFSLPTDSYQPGEL